MATFKPIVSPYETADGTHTVAIRVTHRRKNTSVSTPIRVGKKQLTRSLKLKDHKVLNVVENIIQEWRAIVAELGNTVDDLNVNEIVSYLRNIKHSSAHFRLDLVEHIRKVASTKRGSTANNYKVVANSLERYLGKRRMDINDLTAPVLSAYEKWLRKEKIAPGTIVQYMTLLKSAHNAACYEYNDEDSDIILVRRSPFKKYKIPASPASQARGIDLTTMQAIADLDDEPRSNSLRNLVRDVFMLSFALGGMNYADMWALPYSALRGDFIEYQRQKTKGARVDGALYRVRICPEVRQLVEYYFDKTRRRAFRFHIKYKTQAAFAVALSNSVKLLEAAVPYDRHYTFYAARHTYASLARNVVGLDKYTVHELLNHTDANMRITDRYIERDWQRLYEAHSRVVGLIDWTKICSLR
jgi:integrase